MSKYIRKTIVYLGATLTVLIGIKVGFGLPATQAQICSAVLVSLIVTGAIAWFEVFRGWKRRPFRSRRKDVEESISLTLRRAVDGVRFAARDDEAIAAEANDIVRHGLDKHCIEYD